MSNQNDQLPRINPRVRAYGKARLDIARRAQSRQDWDTLWKKPLHEFPFTWGAYWKQSIEYRVADFAAEIGFFIDVPIDGAIMVEQVFPVCLERKETFQAE